MEEVQSKTPIHLTFRSVEKVIVEPDDEDRFVTTAREAARACQRAQSGNEEVAEWAEEFKRFLSHTHEWCNTRSDKIEACYVDVGDGGLRVSVCVSSDDFDFEFDDQITELDIQLAEEFPGCLSEVTQIPRQVALRAELQSDTAILVYGNSERSPEPSGTQ